VADVVVVTGATSGIGLAAAMEFARRGAPVALVGREPARLAAAAERVRAVAGQAPPTFRADFAVLADVRALADALRSAYPRIAVLASNAGAIGFAPVTTVDGFEQTIQVNHLSPFLLAALLRDRTDRIVVTASHAHAAGRLDPDDLNGQLRSYAAMRAYGTSKQANILFAAEAARRWPDTLTTAFHPGLIRSGFGRDNRLYAIGMRIAPFLRSPARGADTLVWLATEDAGSLVNGGYYADRKLRRPRGPAADPALAGRLWEASVAAVGL
jgi:NAD(P)-dependent dehydrogenase (short-subunit alcohol dehydrogenase family)